MAKKITYSYSMTAEMIDAAIPAYGKRVGTMREDAHKIAVSIARNWAEHGAVNVAADKMTAFLGNIDAAHAQKLVNWCNVHLGFELEGSGDDAKFVYTKTTLSTEEWNEAKAQTMFALTPDSKPQPFNFNAELAKLIAKAEKRPSSTKKTDEDVIDAAQLAAAKALLADDAS